ncbi:MAG: hypothetical protein QXY50_02755 [Candidatus Caldarchaeum sp.]
MQAKKTLIAAAVLTSILTIFLITTGFTPAAYTVSVNDGVKASDRFGPADVNVYVYKNGELVAVSHNIITNAGTKLFRDAIHVSNKTAADKARYIALSTDGTAPAYTDTSCPSEITSGGLQRANATVTTQAGPANGDITVRVENTFTASSAFSGVQKACLWTQSSGGILYAVATFSAVNLAANDQLTIRWDFSYNN